MNAEQKQRAQNALWFWQGSKNDHEAQLAGGKMAALLQELIDAPEVDPVATVTGYYGGHLSISTIDGRVLPAGTALYLAPPAPSVPDEELQAAFDRGLKAGNGQKEAQQVEIHRLHDLLAAAPQPPRLSDERILEIWASNSGRPVTMGKARIIAQARAIEREILGGAQA